MRPDDVRATISTLDAFADSLESGGQSGWATEVRTISLRLSAAGSDPARQREIARLGLSMYGGMGSISDVVLQDATGFIPGNDEMDQLRRSSHDALVDLIAGENT